MADVIDNKAKQPSSGTGFTNLQRVLNANQANRLGSTIGSGVSNVVGQANKNLGQAQQQFGEQSQKGAVGTEQDKQYVQQTLQDPTKAEQSDVDKFSRFRQGYLGPQGLQDDKLKAQQQELGSLGNLTQNSGGRQALLQRFVGSPQYNQGQQRLDTMLLGQTGGGNLNQLRRQTQQANQSIGQAMDTAQNQAALLKAQSAGFGEQVGQQIGGAQTAQQQELEGRAQQYTGEQQALHDMMSSLLTANSGTNTNSVSQEQYDKAMTALNRSGKAGQDLLGQSFYGASATEGFDPSTLLKNINPYTKENVATEQDLAKAQALSKLSGDETPSGLAAQQAAGTYDPLAFLNQENLQKYEQKGKGIYDTAQEKIRSSDQYKADVNRVKDIAMEQGKLMEQAAPGEFGGGPIAENLPPELKAKYDQLATERWNLVNKNSLMSDYGILNSYNPSTFGGSPYYQSVFDQAIAQKLGSAQNVINENTPIAGRYNTRNIGEHLKNLLEQSKK